MNNLMIFENKPVEVFEFNGQVLFNPYHVGECLEISPEGVRKAITRMNKRQVIKLTNSKVTDSNFRKLHNTGENFLTESGVYKLIFKSKKKEAEKFQDWVTDEVIPQIRKTGQYSNKLLSPTEQLELQLKVLKEQDKRIDQVNEKVENLKDNMPLFGVESDELQALVRKYGVKCLGGYHSPAYNDKSLRARVYADIQGQLKREFGVKSYKGIKRCQLDTAKKIIERYELPIVLEDEVKTFNNQISFKKVM